MRNEYFEQRSGGSMHDPMELAKSEEKFLPLFLIDARGEQIVLPARPWTWHVAMTIVVILCRHGVIY